MPRTRVEQSFFGDTPASQVPVPALPPVAIRNLPALAQGHVSLGPNHLSVFEQLREVFSGSSVHMKASVQVSIEDPTEETRSRQGTGSYEYWSSGDMFRTRSHALPELRLVSSSETAYNLDYYQQLTHADSYLRLSDDYHGTIEPIPNPLFMVVPFLYLPFDDYCGICTPSPSEVGDISRWSEVLSRGAVAKDGSIALPGGTRLDRPYFFRLQVSPHGHIEAIDTLYLNGERIWSVRLGSYSPVPESGTRFPSDIALAFFANGEKVVEYRYYIHDLRMNVPIDDDVFTLEHISADVVVDVTAQSILKHHQIAREEWDSKYQ